MPTLNFTTKTLDALKLSLSKQSEEYWDSSISGFGLRMSKRGKWLGNLNEFRTWCRESLVA